jgi:membrane associated rhomboid family serine protease
MSFTLIIIIITGFITYKGLSDRSFQYKMMFNPYQVYQRKEWYRLVSHGFIHADFMHVAFNLYALWMFGPIIDSKFAYYFPGKSATLYGVLYIGGVVASSLMSLEKHKNNPTYNALGASGAFSAVVFAAIMMDPMMHLSVFFIPMRGWMMGILYLGYSHYMSKKNIDNIGHDAHFWGAVFGLLIMVVFRFEFLEEFFEKLTII